MMGVVSFVLLVLLVWTFTSVCVADDEITIKCEDVTAYVGDKINLNCKASILKEECCMKMYRFINTVAADDPTICREDFSSDSCKRESRFSCSYTAYKPMTTRFRFYLQTTCGAKTSDFSVTTTEITSICGDVTAHVGNKINLTCTVTNLNKSCCMTLYKFTADDPTICRKEFSSDSCKQESRFSCPYTANKAMTTKVKLFVRTTCGTKTAYFSVSTTGAVEDDTGVLQGGSNTIKDKDITINCEDVTAHVGDKINLTCTVSNLNKSCCMTLYKFINTADDPTICRKEFSSDPCKQESRVSCPYTANEAKTTKVKFFLQSNCSAKTAYFSVSTTGAVEDDTGGTNTLRYKEALAVIIPVIICLIIIIMGFILKKKLNFNNCRFHRNYDTEVSERNISLCSDRETVEQ